MSRIAVVALLALLAVAPRRAHADAWSAVEFVGPGGNPAAGIASGATDAQGTRLVIGCETTGSGAWRGIAILTAAPAPAASTATGAGAGAKATPATSDTTPVVLSFYGRVPVTERWRSTATPGGVLWWADPSEPLLRKLQREDKTRGQAALNVELRAAGGTQKLTFPIGGLGAHGEEIAARCDGFGADRAYRRRERGW